MIQGREYLDFELDISLGSDGQYIVAVDSLSGEARTEMIFPFDYLELKNHLQALQIALLQTRGPRRVIRSPRRRRCRHSPRLPA